VQKLVVVMLVMLCWLVVNVSPAAADYVSMKNKLEYNWEFLKVKGVRLEYDEFLGKKEIRIENWKEVDKIVINDFDILCIGEFGKVADDVVCEFDEMID